MTTRSSQLLAAILFCASPAIAAERPIVTYTLNSSVDTNTSTGQQIAACMAAAVENYNRYAVFPGPADGSSFPMRVYYSSGVPTAQASGNGSITFGGQRNTRVAQHEMVHVFGAGQHWQWPNLMVGGVWQGNYTKAVIQSLDGAGAGLYGDAIHFWPYGLNYDSEWNTTNAKRNVIVTAAFMRDMGIGYTWPPVNGPANGTYRLTPAHATGMALRTTGTASGSAMDIAAYGGGTDQQFRLERQPDGTYEIKSAQPGNRNLNLPGATTSVGAVLQMTNDNNTDAQRWILEPHASGFRITSHNHLLRVLEAAGAGATDGTAAQTGDYSGTTGNHQLWNLTAIPGTDSQTIAYWHGDVSGLWNAPVSGNTNWANGYNRSTDLGRIPDSLTTVFIGAGTANRNTTLGQDFTIPGLIFDGPNAASIGGSHNLTLGGDGIDIGLIAGAATIDTSGQVILGADQTWTNHSLNPLTVASQITGTARLTVAGAGSVLLTGDNTYSGGTEIAGGTLQVGNGGTTGSLQGNLINNGGRLTFNRSSSLSYGGGISGNGGLRKIGAGILTLTGANTYSGGTDINGGAIAVSTSTALGSGDVAPAGGRLQISSGITLTTGGFWPGGRTNSPSSSPDTCAFENLSGNNTITGSVNFASVGGSHVNILSTAGTLTFNGAFGVVNVTGNRYFHFTGAGDIAARGVIANGNAIVGVVKGGSGTLTLTGANTYTGGTAINAGRLFSNSSGMNGGGIFIASGATLTFTGHNQTNSSTLTGAGAIVNDTPNTIVFTGNHSGFNGTFSHTAGGNNTQFNSASSGSPNAAYQITAGELIFAANGDYTVKMGSLASTGGNIRGGNAATGTTTLEIGNLGTDTSIAGNLNNGGTKILSLRKVGGGSLTLLGTNNLSGATTVVGGSLIVNGSDTATPITVANGASLRGSGSVGAVIVQAGGILAPGTSIGPLNTGTTTIHGTLAIEVANSENADRLNASGSVDLTGPLVITAPAGLPGGTAFTIINKTSLGPVNGTFSGLPQDSLFDAGGNTWVISYSGGDGNDVVITLAALTPGETWRQQSFGDNWQDDAVAGDTADPDGDGVPNLLERAFGGDPNVADQSILPRIDPAAPLLSIIYRKVKFAEDLIYEVQQSTDLSSTEWSMATGEETPILDNGAVETLRFTTPVESALKKFLRVRVKAIEPRIMSSAK